MLVLLLFLVFITPVQVTLRWQEGLHIGLRVWGVGIPRPAAKKAKPQGAHPGQAMCLVKTALRADRARRFLWRHTRLVRLQALVTIGLQDAAGTALVTGLLRQLAALLPSNTDVRVEPCFVGPSRVQARCILFFHLGTILITAGMGLAAYLLEVRHHPLSRPKEA